MSKPKTQNRPVLSTSKLEKDTSGEKNSGFKTPEKKAIIPKTIPAPTKVYTSNIGRSRSSTLKWEYPEWDLVEVGRITDTESYLRRAIKIKKNLFTKEGYEFTSSNIVRLRYIKRRLQQMEQATNVPFPILMSETISSLVRLHNAFWVKVRNEESSGGHKRTTPDGKILEPIAGYFILPAESVRIRRDEYGKIKSYKQEVWGKEPKEFRPEDVIHFYLERRPGYSVGTPSVVPVKDDIRALRRIEENVELLIYQHLFPLFHYKVGTPEAPAAIFPDGSSEIDVVRVEIARVPSDGCWVTPERHEIKPLQASSSPIAVEKIIEHFKQRIFTGLGVSSVDMGEGGSTSRSTAQTMSRNLVDDTKADQREFGAQFYSFVIQELLLESTFPDSSLLDEENRVYIKFKEIDFESRTAKENHVTDMYLKNIITHDEARQMIGLEPFVGFGWPTSNSKSKMLSTAGDGDFARTNYALFERDKVILQALDEPGTEASTNEAKSRTTANTNKSAGGNSVSNKNKPANQHGTRPSAKVNKDMIDTVLQQGSPISDIYSSLRKDIVNEIRKNGVNLTKIKLFLNMSFTEAKDRLILQSKQAYRVGLSETNRTILDVQISKIDAKIQDHVTKYIDKLYNDLLNKIDLHTLKKTVLKLEDAVFVELVFDAFQHRSGMVDSSEIMRAYNYGLTSGYRLNGFQEISSIRNSNTECKICDTRTLKYSSLDAIIYEDLPPFHPLCDCRMKGSNNRE
jgi:hypothetical protein